MIASAVTTSAGLAAGVAAAGWAEAVPATESSAAASTKVLSVSCVRVMLYLKSADRDSARTVLRDRVRTRRSDIRRQPRAASGSRMAPRRVPGCCVNSDLWGSPDYTGGPPDEAPKPRG